MGTIGRSRIWPAIRGLVLAVCVALILALPGQNALSQTAPPDIRPMSVEETARAEALFNEASALFAANEFARAEASLRALVDLHASTLGPRHPRTAEAMTSLALALQMQSKFDDARIFLVEALEIQRQRNAGDLAIGDTAFALGRLELARQQTGEAQRHFTEAAGLYERANAPTGVRLELLAWQSQAHERAGAFSEAADTLLEALQLSGGDAGVAMQVLPRRAALLERARRFSEADEALRRAGGYAEGNPGEQWRILVERARVATLAGDHAGAYERLMEALAIAEVLNSRYALTNTIGLIGNNGLARGAFDTREARALLERYERRGDASPATTADLLRSVAGGYIASDRADMALPYLRRAAAIYESAVEDPPGLAWTLNAMAQALELSDPPDAERLFRRSASLREAWLVDHPETAADASWGFMHAANFFRRAGRLDEARAFEQRRSRILEACMERAPPAVQETCILAGASRTAAQVRALLAQRDPDGQAVSEEIMMLRRQLAVALWREGDPGNSAIEWRRVIAVSERLPALNHYSGSGPQLMAGHYSSLARTLEEMGRLEEAEEAYQTSLRFRQGQPGEIVYATADEYSALAGVQTRRGQYEAAAASYRQAALIGERITDNGRILAAREALARNLLRRGRHDEAREAAEAAWRARRPVQSRAVNSPAEIEASTSAQRDAGATLTRTLWMSRGAPEAERFDAAFEIIQTTGASSTATAFAANAARIAGDRAGHAPLVQAWTDARETLVRLEQAIGAAVVQGAEADDRRRELNARWEQTRAELTNAENALRSAWPPFFDLVASPALSVAGVQSHTLAADEALILLTPGDMRLPEGHRGGLVLVATREGRAWAEIELDPAEITGEIAALHAQLETGGVTRALAQGSGAIAMSGARGFDRARAHRLYQALFGAAPVAALLRDKSRWTLAPTGVLLSAPYAALVSAAPAGGERGDFDPAMLRQTQWLGLERTLSLTPSVSALRVQRRLAPVSAGAQRIAFFGLGDPLFLGEPGPRGGLEAPSVFANRSGNVAAIRALPRLPGTRAEIEQLARAFGASGDDYVLDAVATETELNRRNANQSLLHAEVVAFATHGLMAGQLSDALAEPALALTPPAEASEADDGLLTASDAARLRLNARWVILSACNTAAGGRPDAEGLTGLARAFFYAGARTLLVSQWQVNDEAAQRLTTRAVQLQRAENISTAEAMRRSMAELSADPSRDAAGRSFAHPSAWAPFILVSGE